MDCTNAVDRLNDNVKMKWVELANEIDDFVKSKLVELEAFIDSHKDCFYDEEDICPACGHALEFGEKTLKFKEDKNIGTHND